MPAPARPRSADDHLTSKAPERIAGMFDAIARRYDLLNHLLSAGFDRRWRARAIRELALSGRERVVDLCTGTADLAIAAVDGRAAGARSVIGIDFSGEMLRVARAKLRRIDRRVALVRADAMRIPLASASADAVTIAFGIRNVQDPVTACIEIGRILRPDGRLAILEFGIPPAPLLRAVYLWYFRRMLPSVGRLISRHGHAYAYLPASVHGFPAPDAFAAQLARSGFRDVHAIPLTFGIVYLYTALKC